jgi:HSP20 family molecular chaperone IbpA
MVYSFSHHVPNVCDAVLYMDPTAYPRSHLDRPAAIEYGSQSGGLSMNPRYQHVATESADILSVELPGVDKSNVQLEVRDFTLRITGERLQPSVVREMPINIKKSANAGKADNANGDHMEASHVEGKGFSDVKVHPASTIKYSATFSLEKVADVGAISADHKNGLLTVTIPHKPTVTRRIELH